MYCGRLASARLAYILVANSSMVVNRTLCPPLTASMPRAIARCDLPTPGGPSRIRFSRLRTNSRVARSRMVCWLTEV